MTRLGSSETDIPHFVSTLDSELLSSLCICVKEFVECCVRVDVYIVGFCCVRVDNYIDGFCFVSLLCFVLCLCFV